MRPSIAHFSPLAGSGHIVVLRHMRRDVGVPERSDVIGSVIGFVLSDRDAMTGFFGFCSSIASDSSRSEMPLASVIIPATASPFRFSIVKMAHVAKLPRPRRPA
jgi:hypothetical protein